MVASIVAYCGCVPASTTDLPAMLAHQKSKQMPIFNPKSFVNAKIDIFLTIMLFNFEMHELQSTKSLLILFVLPRKILKNYPQN